MNLLKCIGVGHYRVIIARYAGSWPHFFQLQILANKCWDDYVVHPRLDSSFALRASDHAANLGSSL